MFLQFSTQQRLHGTSIGPAEEGVHRTSYCESKESTENGALQEPHSAVFTHKKDKIERDLTNKNSWGGASAEIGIDHGPPDGKQHSPKYRKERFFCVVGCSQTLALIAPEPGLSRQPRYAGGPALVHTWQVRMGGPESSSSSSAGRVHLTSLSSGSTYIGSRRVRWGWKSS